MDKVVKVAVNLGFMGGAGKTTTEVLQATYAAAKSSRQAQEHRASWAAQGFGEQYTDGYFRNTGLDHYPDGSGAQDAWQAGYDDWHADVEAGCEVKP